MVIVHLSNKKDTAHRKAINKDTPEAWDKYKKLRKKLRNLVDAKYKHYIADTTEAVVDNPKRFWGLLKTKTKNKNIPENIHNEDVTENTSIGKAKLFNNFFYSNFSSTANDSNLPPINEVRNQHLCSLNVSIAETRLVLDNIDPNKATGPDNISGRILKECSKEISPSLTALFNLFTDRPCASTLEIGKCYTCI